MNIENCIENYINGNLQDAKKQAKKYMLYDIIQELFNYGFTSKDSHAIGRYLKNKLSWDELHRII